MFRNIFQRCAGAALVPAVLLGAACKLPETVLRERPVQRVELVQSVQGMTAKESADLLARLSEGLGVPAPASSLAAGPARVLKVGLEGWPNTDVARGAVTTTLKHTALGAIAGAALAFWGSPTLGTALACAGAGAVIGLGVSPGLQEKWRRQKRELGYVPWVLRADWDVVERDTAGGEKAIARHHHPLSLYSGPWEILDMEPHLRPLPPERRSEADARRASLHAFAEALLQRLGKGPVAAEAKIEYPKSKIENGRDLSR